MADHYYLCKTCHTAQGIYIPYRGLCPVPDGRKFSLRNVGGKTFMAVFKQENCESFAR